MKKTRKSLALVLAVVMVVALAGCAGNTSTPPANSATPSSTTPTQPAPEAQKLTLKIAGTVPDEHPITQALYKFEEEAEAKSSGNIQVEVYANAQLGTGREVIEGVQVGNVQMGETTLVPFASFTEEYMAISLPFLFPNREVAYAFADGEVGKRLADIVAKQTGVLVLGYFENGIRQFTNSKRPIHSPEDMKGLKVRVMESPIYIQTFTTLGANPMPMAFAELYTALQQKTVDAQDNPYAITATNKFYEVQAYMSDLSHSFDFTGFLINYELYQGLSDDNLKVVNEAGKIATDHQRKLSMEKEQGYKDTIKAHVKELTELTNEERAVFRKTVEPVYDYFKANYKPEVSLDEIVAEVERIKTEKGIK